MIQQALKRLKNEKKILTPYEKKLSYIVIIIFIHNARLLDGGGAVDVAGHEQHLARGALAAREREHIILYIYYYYIYLL